MSSHPAGPWSCFWLRTSRSADCLTESWRRSCGAGESSRPMVPVTQRQSFTADSDADAEAAGHMTRIYDLHLFNSEKNFFFCCRNIPVIRRKFSDVSRGGSLGESKRLFVWVKLSFTFTMTMTLALYGQFKRIVSMLISNVSLCTKHLHVLLLSRGVTHLLFV